MKAERNSGERGFTLMEVVMATTMLGVSLLGLAASLSVAIRTNQMSRGNSEAGMVAERELEQLGAQPLSAASFTDASGNTVSLAAGGCPLSGGKLDFTRDPVTNYAITATGSSGARYDVRWNVQTLGDGTKQFTVGARQAGVARFQLPPVNLWLRVGR